MRPHLNDVDVGLDAILQGRQSPIDLRRTAVVDLNLSFADSGAVSVSFSASS